MLNLMRYAMNKIKKIALFFSIFIFYKTNTWFLPSQKQAVQINNQNNAPCSASLTLGTQDFARAVALQTDGKIVGAGFSVINKQQQILVARYNSADGSLDCTFGTNGVITSAPGSQQAANAVIVQINGKIVIAGELLNNRKNQFFLQQYNPDGSPDTSFGSMGTVITTIGDGASVSSIGLQSDGKIMVAGSAVINHQPNMIVARYNVDGSADSTFGQNGIAVIPVGKRSKANALVIQSDGKIVAGGSAAAPNESLALIRLNTNGTLDSSFGSGGIALNSVSSTNVIRALALDSLNNIVVSGYVDGDFMVGRYTASGQPDVSFGTNGFVISMIGSTSESNGVAVQTDNKIVAAGFADITGVIYARYNTDGTPDSSFGISGTGILTIVEVGNAAAKALVLQPDSKIVGAGFSCNDATITRLATNGTPDTTFGINGIVNNPKGVFCPSQAGASGPLVKKDDKK